jgi:hypothetical protein
MYLRQRRHRFNAAAAEGATRAVADGVRDAGMTGAAVAVAIVVVHAARVAERYPDLSLRRSPATDMPVKI